MTKTAGQLLDRQLDLATPPLLAAVTGNPTAGPPPRRHGWRRLTTTAAVIAQAPLLRRLDRRIARTRALRQLGRELVREGILRDTDEALQLCRSARLTDTATPPTWTIHAEIIRGRLLHTLLVDGDHTTLRRARLLRRGPQASNNRLATGQEHPSDTVRAWPPIRTSSATPRSSRFPRTD